MHRNLRLAALLAAALLATPLPALAFGASSDSESEQTDACKSAKDLIDDEQYSKAVPLLEQSIKEKGEYADALNLLGYSHRKLGHKDKAMTYYLKVLSIDPKHLGANEYLGELYLEMNDLAKAQERLEVLAEACKDCEELEDLEDEIEDWKEEHGQS